MKTKSIFVLFFKMFKIYICYIIEFIKVSVSIKNTNNSVLYFGQNKKTSWQCEFLHNSKINNELKMLHQYFNRDGIFISKRLEKN